MTRPLKNGFRPLRAAPARRRGFLRDENGSFIIFGLFIFLAMLVAAGMGVDLMRYEAERARLQATLDRAILAAASLDQTLSPKDVVMDYFAKAGLGDNINRDDVVVSGDGFSSRRIEASASIQVNSTFLKFAGINYLSAPAFGAAEESASLTEISLVVDVSGSMASNSYSGNSKLYEMKRAAKTFTNIILCNAQDTSNSAACNIDTNKASITLVPYAEQVLLGTDLKNAFTVTNDHSNSSCVTFYDAAFSTVAVTTTETLQQTGHFDNYRNQNSSPQSGNAPCQNNSWREVHPFEDRASDMRSEIDALNASGNTSIDLGMKWGAALLDPAAQGAISYMIQRNRVNSQYQGRPYPYDQRGLEKVIVLMTDGENTSQDYLKPGFHSGNSPVWKSNSGGYLSIYDQGNNRWWWVSQGKWEDHAYGTGTYQECSTRWSWWYGWYTTCNTVNEGNGAYAINYVDLWNSYTVAWWNQWSWLPSAAGQFNYNQKNTHLDSICTAAKTAGVTIFTIGFEVDSDQDTVMRNCASAPSYYFNANGLNISAAFGAIAREISKLRLVN